MRRCSPMVVPGLPPAGSAGVRSLRPWPGGSALTGTTSAADALAPKASASIVASRVLVTGDLLGNHGRGRFRARFFMADGDRTVRVLDFHQVDHAVFRQFHGDDAVGDDLLAGEGFTFGARDRKSVV